MFFAVYPKYMMRQNSTTMARRDDHLDDREELGVCSMNSTATRKG